MYFIDSSKLANDGYRFALLRETPKVIHITNSLSLKDRVIKTMEYKRLEFDTATKSAKASSSYGTVIEFTGPCIDIEAETGFWECDAEIEMDSNSPQGFAKLRTSQATKMAQSINKKYHK